MSNLSPDNTHMVVPLIQVLISYIPDSITFVNLSKTCKTIYRLCCNNTNQLKFKHGIQSQREKHGCTLYKFFANGKLICAMILHNMSKKRALAPRSVFFCFTKKFSSQNGLSILYFHHSKQFNAATYNYRYDKLIGHQMDSNGRDWWVPLGKNAQVEPEWKLTDYREGPLNSDRSLRSLGISTLSYPKKEDMDMIARYHDSLLALLR